MEKLYVQHARGRLLGRRNAGIAGQFLKVRFQAADIGEEAVLSPACVSIRPVVEHADSGYTQNEGIGTCVCTWTIVASTGRSMTNLRRRIRLESEAKLEIQQRIKDRKIELAWSYVLDYENQANPFEERSRYSCPVEERGRGGRGGDACPLTPSPRDCGPRPTSQGCVARCMRRGGGLRFLLNNRRCRGKTDARIFRNRGDGPDAIHYRGGVMFTDTEIKTTGIRLWLRPSATYKPRNLLLSSSESRSTTPGGSGLSGPTAASTKSASAP